MRTLVTVLFVALLHGVSDSAGIAATPQKEALLNHRSGQTDGSRMQRVEQASPQPAPQLHSAEASTARLVAVTFDDLPAVRAHDLRRMQEKTVRLLDQIAALQMPVVGFVNECKLGEPTAEPGRIALLEQWVDAGHELGNHTYAHPSLYDTALPVFEEDVLRGEAITKRLLAERGQEIRYFRHPYLNTGPDLETKTAFEQFLTGHGYAIAPVTIDSDEYIYALAYARAEAAENTGLSARIGRDYVRYMDEMFVFYEQLSRDLMGREPIQILLLHANALNADYLDELAGMMRARGYEFVTLETTLRDAAYTLPDQYAGKSGLSWLQRWWITQGNDRREEPGVPEWVREVAYSGT